jgi:hypothetical protein
MAEQYKKSLFFNASRKGDKRVIAWVNTIAAHLRVAPQTVARLMMMDGCAAFAKQHNLALPSGTESLIQSADAD